MIIATAQSPITGDVRQNGKTVRSLMRRAARKNARLIHFPEGALSGYSRDEVASFEDFDFTAIEEELRHIAQLAGDLGMWVALGCAHRLSSPNRPHNSLYIISDRGKIHARYDKRRCSNNEINNWYSPGFDACMFDIDGVRFGCALCIEIQFPELFLEARKQGVDCLLFSAYSKDPMFGITAQGYAATYNFWLSYASPANDRVSRTMPSRFIGPDGHIIARCRAGASTLTLNHMDRDAPQWEIPLRRARPWRASARDGAIYEARRVDDPRSTQKTVI